MLRHSFILFFGIKLLLSTLFIFGWVGNFENVNAFFNCSVESFDSLRYNHDAYVFATGQGEYFGEAFKNFFSVLYGGLLYKAFFVHPWIITFFNSLISSVSTWALYKSLSNIMPQKRMKDIFLLSHFMPVLIAYEAVLGKEVFYLAAYKLLFAVAALLYFNNDKKAWGKITIYTTFILLFSIIRSILIPSLALVVVAKYVKPKWLWILSVIGGTFIMVVMFSGEAEFLQKVNDISPSSNPIMQILRTFFITDNPVFNLLGGFIRSLLYLTYPLPLVIPKVWGYSTIPIPEDKCSAMLTISDQLSFWWQLILIWLLHKTPIKLFTKQQLQAWQYFFALNVAVMIVFAYSFTMIHARYRIFFFLMYVSFIVFVKKNVFTLSKKDIVKH